MYIYDSNAEVAMDYISVREAAEKWGVSERWVQKFCVEDRIPGVQRFGHSWMIPKDALRPNDLRRKEINENNREENNNA